MRIGTTGPPGVERDDPVGPCLNELCYGSM